MDSFGQQRDGERLDSEVGPGLLEAVWRYRWLVAATALLAGAVGFAASFLQAVRYEAQAQLLLSEPGSGDVFDTERSGLDPSRYVRNQAELVESTAVGARAQESLDLGLSLDQVLEQTSATGAADLDVLTITASYRDPAGAAQLADALAIAYQEQVAQEVQANAEAAVEELTASTDQLQAEISRLESELAGDQSNTALQAQRDAAVAQLVELEARAEEIAVNAALYGAGVRLFEKAEIPESPAQPQPIRNAAIAFVLGLVAASAFAWWRAEHAQLADSRHEPAAILGVPLLGEVPDFAAVGVSAPAPTVSAKHSAAAEAYQYIVASLDVAVQDSGAQAVLLTSPGPADGKTVTALNLAIAAVDDGRRVVLVDADERVRGLTNLSNINPSPGLTDLADEDLPFDGCVAAIRLSEDDHLPFIPVGSQVDDPAGFFRTPAFRKSMLRIKEHAEFILVDTPPLLAVADTSAIAAQVDGIVVVVAKGTPLRALEEIRERLDFVGTPVLGYVFNRSSPRSGAYGAYGYGGTATGGR